MRTRLLASTPCALLSLALACGGPEPDAVEVAADAVVAPACGAAKLAELLAPATAAAPSVVLDCSATLAGAAARITKKVVIQGASGSGVRLDCRGGTLAPTQSGGGTYSLSIRSQRAGTTWRRPEGVVVQGCTIHGSVRVYGLGTNGEGAEVRASSHSAGHTARAQAAAPTDVLLQRLHIIGSGTVPLYLAPGTTRVSFLDSEISGTGSSVAIYLDAESGHHLIRGNSIHLDSASREQIAVDGSAHNRIFSNRFSSLSTGGIYLYRNCGEGGTVRHQSPTDNQIMGNVFYYDRYSGSNPSVWLASRNGNRGYCGDDAGHPFGSSVDDRDFARDNVVADNLIYVRSVADMIRASDSPNHLFANRTVTTGSPIAPGSFFTADSGRDVYLSHGQTFAERTAPADVRTGTRYTCRDNALTADLALPLVTSTFACSRGADDAGCSVSVACPAGRHLVGLRAACNLETESLAASELTATAWDRARVARASDVVRDGTCAVGDVRLSSGQASLEALLGGRSALTAACRERDQNGGDCAVRAAALCL